MAGDWETLTPKESSWESLKPAGSPPPAQGAPVARGYSAADVLFAPDVAANIGSGMLAAPVSGLVGLAGSMLPGPPGQGADWTNRTQEMLTIPTRTKLGGQTAELIQAPLEAWAKGAEGLGDRVLDKTGSPEAATFVDTAIQGLPMALGRVAQPRINRSRVLADTEAAVREKLAAPRDAVIDYAKDKGLVISPAEANPSLLNRIMEGFSGQSKVQLQASSANQPTFNNIVRGAFGIGKDIPLSMEALADVRKTFGKAYEKVRNLGEIAIDEGYGASLDKISAKYEGAAKSFPAEASEVQKAVDSARKTVTGNSFDSSAAIDKISIERAKGDKAFKQGDTELGKAHKSIADAIENQIERHLEKVANAAPGSELYGAVDFGEISKLRQAREVIAKTYDVQKALKGENVDVKALANQLKKGKLSGDLKDMAKFGEEFPGSAQVPGKNAPVLGSWGDIGMGGLGGVLSGMTSGVSPTTMGAATGLAAISRPAIRAALTNKTINPLLTKNSYQAPLGLRLGDALVSNPELMGALSQLPQVDQKRR